MATTREEEAYKGLMIDVARHFLPTEIVLETLNMMHEIGLNALHIHFSDDQGFPVLFGKECKLEEFNKRMCAFHQEGYFQEEDLHRIAKLAASYNIQVVPEIDLPGHLEAFRAFYYGKTAPNHVMGLISDDVMTKEELPILLPMLEWLAHIFNSKIVHIGADECKDFHDYPWLVRNVGEWANENGWKVMMYDEVVSKKSVVISPETFIIERWRRQASKGCSSLPCVLSWGSYLDHLANPLRYYRPGVEWMVKDHCLVGFEACLWSELVTPENYWSALIPAIYMCVQGWDEILRGEPKTTRPASLLKTLCDKYGFRGEPSPSANPFIRRRRAHFYREDPRSTTRILRGNPLDKEEDMVHAFDRRLVQIFEYVERLAIGEKVEECEFVAMKDLGPIPDIFSPSCRFEKGWKTSVTCLAKEIRDEEETMLEEERQLTTNALKELCNYAIRMSTAKKSSKKVKGK
jgi:hypothetical protein